MNKTEDEKLMPSIREIRVISCGKDWVSDADATLPVEKIRGFSLDDWGVHLYSTEKDIHGEYDNVNVPYSNLSAVVFYFNRIQAEDLKVTQNWPFDPTQAEEA